MIRQDAWNHDEDLLLAETVLRHIREGGTQLAAFEEVAEKLSRTSAACGFRWNSTVRRQYDSAIQLAKNARKESKRQKVNGKSNRVNRNAGERPAENRDTQWYDQMISFLQEQKAQQQKRLIDRGEEVLEKENKKLKEQLNRISKAYEEVQKDYRTMIMALEKAAKKENTR